MKNMNKVQIGFLIICILVIFSSCENSEKGLADMRDLSTASEADCAKLYMESIVTAVNTQDEDLMTGLFAKSVVQNNTTLSNDIQDFFALCGNEIIEFDGEIGSIRSKQIDGVLIKYAHASYDFTTSDGAYRLAFKFCIKDSSNSSNEGLLSVYMISQSKSDMEFTYWGNYEWNEGIVIE